MIVDAQVYFFPSELGRDPKSWAKKHNEPHWLKLVHPDDRPSRQGWTKDEADFLRCLDRAGVDKAILHCWYWENEDTITWHNRVNLEFANKFPDRLIPFVGVSKEWGQGLGKILSQLVDKGARGIGELLPSVQNFSLRDPFGITLAESAAALNLPITLHVDEQIGRNHLGRVVSPLSELYSDLVQHSKTTWILSHWGGLMPFYELNPAVQKTLSHVYYNTAASPLLYRNQIFPLAIQAANPDKFIFASDFPLILKKNRSASEGLIWFLEEICQDRALGQKIGSKLMAENILNILQL